jgi:glycosyltransferase involved in cell wall biosynthesis
MLIQRFRPTFTGHGIQIERMGRLLTERGCTVEIVTAAVDGAPVREEGAVPVTRLAFPFSRNPLKVWSQSRPLRTLLSRRAGDFDILHVHGAPAFLPVLLPAARGAGLRTVITTTLLHSDDPLTVKRLGRLAAWRFRAYRSADRYVAICPALRDTYPPAGIPLERVAHIPVGVDVERFRPVPDRDAAARAAGLPHDRPRVLFVGLLLQRKGVDVLLDAWEQVLTRIPDAELLIAGGTDFDPVAEAEFARFAAECLQRAGREPLAGHVRFLGPRDDLHRVVPAAHVFLFPSRLEGFPNVVLEALASGTPPVVTRIPGSTDESVKDGVTGYVLEQEDAGGLAERVVELLRNRALRDGMATRARDDAIARYAFPIVADAHLALYRDLVRRR